MSRNVYEAECEICLTRYLVLIGNSKECPNKAKHPRVEITQPVDVKKVGEVKNEK